MSISDNNLAENKNESSGCGPMDTTEKQIETPIKAVKYPNRFKKGQSGNPAGRPKAPDMQLLREALAKCEKKYGRSIYEMFAEMAYKHKEVAIALMKKLIPDQTHVEGEGLADRYTFIQGGQEVDPTRVQRLVALLRERAGEDGAANTP